MSVPDLATIPPTESHSPLFLKRAFNRLLPICLDAVTHTCWGVPQSDVRSQDQREFDKDMEIGELHLKYKNYRGAEFRFHHALEIRENDPDATFKLAKALDRQGKNQEAKELYESYLKVTAIGPQANEARKALAKMDIKFTRQQN